MGLLLHPATARQVDNFIASPSHAVMLVGRRGGGKSSLAKFLATQILDIENIDNYPYQLIISPENKSIGIGAVRQLEHFLSLSVPRQAAYQRVVLIEDASLLTHEAQNALLKNLEEPPAGTLIILNVTHQRSLLPTIRSRSQAISVKSPKKTELAEHFKAQGFSDTQINQSYAISGGLVGLMQAILNDAEHPLLLATDQARRLLGGSKYERLTMVDELSKQPALVQDTLMILQQMAHVSLQKAEAKSARRWQTILTASFNASEELAANAQPKLVLTNLCLSF